MGRGGVEGMRVGSVHSIQPAHQQTGACVAHVHGGSLLGVGRAWARGQGMGAWARYGQGMGAECSMAWGLAAGRHGRVLHGHGQRVAPGQTKPNCGALSSRRATPSRERGVDDATGVRTGVRLRSTRSGLTLSARALAAGPTATGGAVGRGMRLSRRSDIAPGSYSRPSRLRGPRIAGGSGYGLPQRL